jgi:hypothetical protein
MPRGATVNGLTWSDYGPCETCGCVAGWPCHRGARQLKNPHPGRPKTGQESYVSMLAAGAAAGAWSDEPERGPDPSSRDQPEGPEDFETERDPLAPWGWAEIALRGREPGDVIAGNDPRDAKLIDYLAAQAMPPAEADPWGSAPDYDGPLQPTTTETTKETTVAMDPAAEAADWTARLDNAEREPKNPSGKRKTDAEVPRDVDRDQYDRPKLVRAQLQPDGSWRVPFYPPGPEPHAGTPIVELEGFTRASTLGNALEDATGLNRWRTGMVVFGMSRRKDLVLAAQAVPGTEDKKLHRRPLYDIADKALEAAESSSAATVGTALHALTEQADQGTLTVDIGEYQPVLDVYLERMAGWRVVRSETFVVSDYFHAAGTFDRLITPLEPMALVDQQTGEIITVIMPGDLVVVDLKTSTTADYFGAKFFAQLAVYVTGQLYDRDPESPTYGARTPLGQRTDFALILHIPQGGDADGEPVADWHWLDMRAGLALAQLACVNLETRKKRFTRTHMRPVLAQPISADQAAADIRTGGASGRRVLGGLKSVPKALPARDPLGDRHLAAVSGFVTEAQDFPDADADRVDAELAQDHLEPEQRVPAPAALVGSNLGAWSSEDVAAEAERTGESEDQVEDRLERAAEVGVTVHRPPAEAAPDTPLDGNPEREEEAMPGPDETAPLPAGWESREEQALAAEATTEVPKGLGGKLQAAAERNKVEEALIRKIRAASSVRGPDGLKDLYQRASAAGYWTDRVIAAASARRQELEAAG